jgi:3'(2'),5'-bisphosphate nucleotidase
MSQTRPKLEDLIDLAFAAGEVVLRHHTRCAHMEKADGSPVTVADREAEALILTGLARLAPEIPVIAEEAMEAKGAPACNGLLFLVDPIDGTRDFVEGETGEFTVNIALVEEHRPVMGVVLAPALKRLFAGEVGGAALTAAYSEPGQWRATARNLQVGAGEPGALIAVTSRRSTRMDRFLAAAGVGARTSLSSSLKFCLIAAGEADLYPRYSPVSEWDTAAGHAVLAAAGGDVMTLTGEPLRYGRRGGDFLVRGFVAYGGENAQSAARAALSKV